MFRQSGQQRLRARCEDRHDRRGAAPADPDCDAAGRFPLRPSGAGADRADRTEARSAFRGDDRVPFETRGQVEDFGLGWNRSRDGLQSFGTRQLCLAESSGRDNAAVAGPV